MQIYKRIWFDGCFDLFHAGHCNALRLVKNIGETTIVGLHSDDEIAKHKGRSAIMSQNERLQMLSACKWVDNVICNAPYQTSLSIMLENECDVCVHGSDISTLSDGSDSFTDIKNAGKFVEFCRTESISTTDIRKRIALRCSHAFTIDICNFSNHRKPTINQRVVFIDGGFDMFHAGHIELFKHAKEMGDFIIVGLHDDETIRIRTDNLNYPVMSANERAICILSCMYIDDVILGTPFVLTKCLLENMNVTTVISGRFSDGYVQDLSIDPYLEAKKKNMLVEIQLREFGYLTASVIVNRIKGRMETIY